MASFTLRLQGAESVSRNLQRISRELQTELYEAVEQIVRLGAEFHKDNIDRIDTGLMKSSADWKITTRTGAVIAGRFGFTDDYETYFEYQESGTQYITGMFALADAATRVSAQAEGIISAAIARAL